MRFARFAGTEETAKGNFVSERGGRADEKAAAAMSAGDQRRGEELVVGAPEPRAGGQV